MSFRKSFSGFRKKAKDKLSKIKGRTEEIQANTGGDGLQLPALSSQSEPVIVVEDNFKGDSEASGERTYLRPGGSLSVSRLPTEIGPTQGETDDKPGGGETCQEALHPRSYAQAESGFSREERVVGGEQAGRADLPQPDTENEQTPTYAGDPTVPDPAHVEDSSKDKTDWKYTASTVTKLLLRTVERASDAFPPLKSVAAGLCAILDNCEV